MSDNYTISTRWTKNVLQTLAREGLNPEEVCKRAGIEMRHFTKEDDRVPQSYVSRLWQAGEQLSGDATLGLLMGSRDAVLGFHNLVYAFMSFDTLHNAFQAIARHTYVLGSSVSLAIIRKEQGYWIDLQISSKDDPLPNHTYDSSVAWLVHLIKWISGTDANPVKASFTHPCIGSAERYKQVLGCNVEFDALLTGVLVEHEVMDRKIPTADKLMADLNETLVSDVDVCTSYDEFSNQVRAMIKQYLPLHKIKVGDIAQSFNMSSRTFQRRLEGSGWSFRDLIDDVRKALALEYVCQDKYSLELAADKIGYKEPTSFLKNFKRWYGCTPGEYRGNHCSKINVLKTVMV